MICSCGHHQQIHLASGVKAAQCRGRCAKSAQIHTLDDHTGRCTAKCHCEAYSERRR